MKLVVSNSRNNQDIYYLPHGIVTISIQVVNDDEIEYDLLIRPTHRTQPPEYYGYESKKNGKETAQKDLTVIWGGGMTDGYRIKVKPKCKSTKLYFQALHNWDCVTPIKETNYSIYIEAVDISSGRPAYIKRVELNPPSTYSEDVIRMKEVDLNIDSKRLKIFGNRVPRYISRWFGSTSKPEYVEYTGPKYVIKFMDYGDYVSDFIHIETEDSGKPLAEISGDLERSKLHTELFSFIDEKYYVLRVWCYWINGDFEHGNSVISKIIEEDSEYRGRSANLGMINNAFTEIPDIERFDLLISKEKNKVVYVGTDLHWQEMWWSVSGITETALLRFSDEETFPLLIYRMPELLRSRFSTISTDYDPATHLMKDLESNEVTNTSPVVLEGSLSNQRESAKVGKGFHHKHMPYLRNHQSYFPNYCSSTVSNV